MYLFKEHFIAKDAKSAKDIYVKRFPICFWSAAADRNYGDWVIEYCPFLQKGSTDFY